jgi:hypothetical protein
MERRGELGQWRKPARKEVVPKGRRDVARRAVGGGISPYRGSEQGAKATALELCERERPGPLIGTRPQWVFSLAAGDRVYAKHPPLPPADGIRPDM